MKAQISITVDKNPQHIAPNLYSGHQLQSLIHASGKKVYFLFEGSHVLVPVNLTDYIFLEGGEHFVTHPPAHEIVDNPKLPHPIGFELNKEHFEGKHGFHHAKVQVKDILAHDKEAQGCDKLEIVTHGLPVKPEELQPDSVLIVHCHMKFITQPAGNCGDSNLVVTNPILDQQLVQVKEVIPNVEMHPDGSGGHCLVLPGYGLPTHWNQERTDLLIHVPQGYPKTPLDMFWVSPSIALRDGGQPKSADSHQNFLGKSWQRFSWHYQSRAWDHRRDTLMSHIQFCHKRLLQQN